MYIVIAILFSNTAFSQDVIHLKNGFLINAKVLEISSTYIRYKPYLQTNDNNIENNRQIKRKLVN